MPEMNKCQHCGTFVPAEKAFCPNCSEPMEPEETPNRAHSFSNEMMATIRDDPEKYRQMLAPPVKKQEPKPAESRTPEPIPTPAPVQQQPPVAGYNYPQAPPVPLPAAKSSNKGYLIFGISVVVILVLLFVILFAFKVI
ncbi:MAG: Double zinc ribbon [Acidobacteriota bacterium]|nr:Double zinc ribbon [Acidobacteriota bacterium]